MTPDQDLSALPCPFCGEAPNVFANDDMIHIECETVNCPASPISSGDLIIDAHKALAAWNRRAPTDHPRSRASRRGEGGGGGTGGMC